MRPLLEIVNVNNVPQEIYPPTFSFEKEAIMRGDRLNFGRVFDYKHLFFIEFR